MMTVVIDRGTYNSELRQRIAQDVPDFETGIGM